MDFVSRLPKFMGSNDAVWVIVDRLTKSAHLLAIRTTFTLDKLASLYVKQNDKLHGVPVSIVSNRDTRFTSKFWKSLQNALGTQLYFSTVFHQTDGQSKRVIKILENMLRACILDFEGSWEKSYALCGISL